MGGYTAVSTSREAAKEKTSGWKVILIPITIFEGEDSMMLQGQKWEKL